MKKVFGIFCLGFLLTLTALGQTQSQGDARIHAFGTYGLRYENFGTGAGIEYFFAEKFAIMPSYTKLFPEVGKGSNSVSIFVTMFRVGLRNCILWPGTVKTGKIRSLMEPEQEEIMLVPIWA